MRVDRSELLTASGRRRERIGRARRRRRRGRVGTASEEGGSRSIESRRR